MTINRDPWMTDAGYASAIRAARLNAIHAADFQRPRFESWYRREVGECETLLRRDASGNYAEEDASCRWSGWLGAMGITLTADTR